MLLPLPGFEHTVRVVPDSACFVILRQRFLRVGLCDRFLDIIRVELRLLHPVLVGLAVDYCWAQFPHMVQIRLVCVRLAKPRSGDLRGYDPV